MFVVSFSQFSHVSNFLPVLTVGITNVSEQSVIIISRVPAACPVLRRRSFWVCLTDGTDIPELVSLTPLLPPPAAADGLPEFTAAR